MTIPHHAWTCLGCGQRFVEHRSLCLSCGEVGLIVQRGMRPPAAVDAVLEGASAREIISASWKRITSSAYPSLDLRAGCLIVAHGEPGSGKSSWATRFLDRLQSPAAGLAPVCYCSAEEGIGPTVRERLARCGVSRPEFFVCGRGSVDAVLRYAVERKCVGLCIDSVTAASWRPAELRHVLNVTDIRCLIAVVQHNGDGRMAGVRELAHEADCELVMALQDQGPAWRAVKSRYQPTPTPWRPVLTLSTTPAASIQENTTDGPCPASPA